MMDGYCIHLSDRGVYTIPAPCPLPHPELGERYRVDRTDPENWVVTFIGDDE